MTRPLVYLCFFLSGFSGLVNEVVWGRLFVYTMGSSHLSIAVVVSVFMGGLALGSMLGGPLADRASSPLRLYGFLVLGAGLSSGVVAPLLWIADPLVGLAYRLHDGEPGHPFFTLVKALVCAGTILIPTTLMGATLPALARHLTRSLKEVGARLGALYAVNTFGAVAGAAAAGFYLIGWVGLGWSAVIGAGLDVAVGAVVLALTGRSAARELLAVAGGSAAGGTAPAVDLAPPAGERTRLPWAVRIAILAFGISGFVNMCLQLGWTRALIISIGNSTYAFSVIVGVFIFGLAAGGWIAGLFTDRVREPAAAFGWLLVAIASAAGATIPWLGLSPARFAWKLGELARRSDFTFFDFLLAGTGSVALVILPATVLMGMTFPLAGRLRALAAPGVGRAVGAAYAANTLGAILGTALTGFVLLRFLGRVWMLLYLAVALGLLAGIAVLIAAPGKLRSRRFAFLGLWVALLLGLAYPTRPAGVLDPGSSRSLWHPAVFSQGAYRNYDLARGFPSPESYSRAMKQLLEPLYYRDGEVASVAILRGRDDGHLTLNIAGKTEASAGRFSGDTPTQLLLGHLPLLAHPSPRRPLLLGLGGGMSLGAMILHPEVEAVDLLEISPEVEEAARLFFADANHSALTNPKVRKVIGDGRNHLAHTSRTYDVISSEPSNFWIAGVGNLFTEDFHRLVLKRLNPGGIVCQWIYGYCIRTEDYQTALRTFFRVFPHVSIWAHEMDTLLLGSREPVVLDRARLAAALSHPAVRADLAPIGIREPEDVFRYFEADGPAVRRWVGEGPINRDFFPVLEFSSPLGYFNTRPGIEEALDSVGPPNPPRDLFRGFSPAEIETLDARYRQGTITTRFFYRLHAGNFSEALAAYRELAKEGDAWSLDTAAAHLALRVPTTGARRREILRQAREVYDTPELCLADGFRLLPGVNLVSQLEVFRSAARSALAHRWQPYLVLAALEAQAKQLPEAAKSLETAQSRGAPAYMILYLNGVVLGMGGDLAAAEGSLRKALELAPPGKEFEKGEAAYNLGYCLEQQGRFKDAVGAYRQAIDLENDPVRAGIAIARCLRREGELTLAVEEARKALKAAQDQKRESGEARAEIARARAAAGNLTEAIQWMETAARVASGFYERELEELRGQALR